MPSYADFNVRRAFFACCSEVRLRSQTTDWDILLCKCIKIQHMGGLQLGLITNLAMPGKLKDFVIA